MDLARTSPGSALPVALAFFGPTHLLNTPASDVWPETDRHGQ